MLYSKSLIRYYRDSLRNMAPFLSLSVLHNSKDKKANENMTCCKFYKRISADKGDTSDPSQDES